LCESLARPEVRAEEALVGGEHDDERDVGEVVAFRQHLRAEKDPCAPVADGRESLLQVVAPADHVAVDAHERCGREELSERCLDAFRAFADWGELVAAARAGERHRLLGAAVVAGEHRSSEVHREPCIAGMAWRDPAAAGAEHCRRVAAAVQEHEHLAARVEVSADRIDGRRREPISRRVDAKVDDDHARLAGSARALGQRYLDVTAGSRVVQRLERRRRGAEHDGHARALRARDCEVAPGVAESLLLLVRGVVLLVHDDEP
jgi:hypothetical protein